MRLYSVLPIAACAAAVSAVTLAQPAASPDAPKTEIRQSGSPSAKPGDVKVNQVIVYGDDPCAASTDDEITVCARFPESERYRIPPNLRDDPNDPDAISWTRKAERLELAGRTGINSCSTVGPGAGTGCLNQLIKGWAEAEGRDDDLNWARLVEEARRDRLGRIDEESEEIEARERAAGR